MNFIQQKEKIVTILCWFFVCLMTSGYGSLFAQDESKEQAEIGIISAWKSAAGTVYKISKELKVPIDIMEGTDFLNKYKNEKLNYKIILFFNFVEPGGGPPRVEELVVKALKYNPGILVIAGEYNKFPILEASGNVKYDNKILEYWNQSGETNIKNMITYVNTKYLGRGEEVPTVEIYPDGYYHCDAAPKIFSTFQEYMDWYKETGRYKKDAPLIALNVHASYTITSIKPFIKALTDAFEKRDLNFIIIRGGHRWPGLRQELLSIKPELKPDILLMHCCLPPPMYEKKDTPIFDTFNVNPTSLIRKPGEDKSGKSVLQTWDIPVLDPTTLYRLSVKEWEQEPRGIACDGLSMIILRELHGVIEPVVIGGLNHEKEMEMVPERIDRLVGRVFAWLKIRKKTNAEKKVAIVFRHKFGKSEILRGTETGAYLDGPRSMVRFLNRLKEEGYNISSVPKDHVELIDLMMKKVRNVGMWGAGALDDLVKNGEPVLIPVSKYMKWFNEKLSEKVKKQMIELHGEPPGKYMVSMVNGEQVFVIPRLDLGNVIIAPQPRKAEEQDAEYLTHNVDKPPPHNFLAFYWWLQEDFKADIHIHFGTHGLEFLLPVKYAGNTKDDYSDIIMGDMVNINPWIADNVPEAVDARRRAFACIVDHMIPPIVGAGLADGLLEISKAIEKYYSLEEGVLREKFREEITKLVIAENLHTELKIDLKERLLTDEEIKKVKEYLHSLENEIIPQGLHVLGTVPERAKLVPYIVRILGKKFLSHLGDVIKVPENETVNRDKLLRDKAEEIIDRILYQSMQELKAVQLASGQIEELPADLKKDLAFAKDIHSRIEQSAVDEMENILRAMNGKFIEPGPGNDPIQNPSSLPTGRNIYALNPEEIPTKSSWEVAKNIVDDWLKKALEKDGKYPRKVGFLIKGFEAVRDYGITESQILYLMGVRPVWDTRGLVGGVEIIPSAELKRPRIDVLLATTGIYTSTFPNLVELLDKAVRLVNELDEKDNYIKQNSKEQEKSLLSKGLSSDRALLLSTARIFGSKPGEYDAGVEDRLKMSGTWDNWRELAEMWDMNMSFVYTKGVWGKKIEGLYDEAIKKTETLFMTWNSNMYSPLESESTWCFFGGLSMSIRAKTGKQPPAFFTDARNPQGAVIKGYKEFLNERYRVELFNRKWIEGMVAHDYAGVRMIAEMVVNTYGYAVGREGDIDQYIWDEIHAIYIKDKYGMNLTERIKEGNPHAFQEIVATLLEAARKGYWKTDIKTLQELAQVYMESVVKSGPALDQIDGGNKKLADYVSKELSASGNKQILASYQAEITRAEGTAQYQPKAKESAIPGETTKEMKEVRGKEEKTEQVQGKEMEKVEEQPPEEQKPEDTEQVRGKEMEKVEAQPRAIVSTSRWVIGFAIAVLLLLIVGYRWRRFPGGKSRS
jgi:cobaltochelatase CobN